MTKQSKEQGDDVGYGYALGTLKESSKQSPRRARTRISTPTPRETSVLSSLMGVPSGISKVVPKAEIVKPSLFRFLFTCTSANLLSKCSTA